MLAFSGRDTKNNINFGFAGNYPVFFNIKRFPELVPTLYPSPRGGGVDCTKLSDDNFSLKDLEDQTGDWQRVAAYSSWLDARIFEETEPSREMFQSNALIILYRSGGQLGSVDSLEQMPGGLWRISEQRESL